MLAITVHFPLGTFQANSNDDLSAGEWPPHPSRLFAGLVSLAESASDVAALQWLESLSPPTVHASAASDTIIETRSNYVVTNSVDRKGRTYQTLPARSGGGSREWVSATPEDPNVTYIWDVAHTVHADAISNMCRRLPYLGRSTSPAVAWLEADGADIEFDSSHSWAPSGDGDVVFGVPGRGYYQSLEDAFQQDQRPWSVSPSRSTYRSPDLNQEAYESTPTPFEDREWIVFRIDGRKVPYPALVALTDRFRSAVLSSGGDDAPAILHGHGTTKDPAPQERVMFLGLPFVGHPKADGRIRGFAVSIPKGIDDAVRLAVYRALVGVDEIRHPRIGRVRLTRRDADSIWAIDPRRWSQPATRWVTAYPAVLDRFIRKPDQVSTTIAGMCQHVGLPEPVSIEWSPSPLTPGPERLTARQTTRNGDQDLHKFFHVRLEFAKPVAGPIVLGHMRHFGLGLMFPEPVRDFEPEGDE